MNEGVTGRCRIRATNIKPWYEYNPGLGTEDPTAPTGLYEGYWRWAGDIRKWIFSPTGLVGDEGRSGKYRESIVEIWARWYAASGTGPDKHMVDWFCQANATGVTRCKSCIRFPWSNYELKRG